MKFYRIPTKQEEQLIELLVHKSSLEMSEDWKNGLLVCPMDDGEMGSLYLFPQGKINESRKLGRQISEFQFTDIDGVEVIASLNVVPTLGTDFHKAWKKYLWHCVREPEPAAHTGVLRQR